MKLKRPLTLNLVLTIYILSSLVLLGLALFVSYIGLNADNGTMSEYQSKFITGMGFDPNYFSFVQSGAYVGAVAPGFTINLISMLFLLKRWNVAFAFVFLVDLIVLTSGIGYVSKVAVIGLFATPSCRKYFKPVNTVVDVT